MGWSGFRPYRGRVALVASILSCLFLTHCGSASRLISKVDPKYGVAASPRVVAPGEPVPKGGGVYRVGKPYVVAGRTYVPEADLQYRREGLASWYGDDFHGRLTANGEVYDMESISAAHPTLPMPSYVRVTNQANRRSLIVRVNDRGPYHANREIDLSYRAAHLLGFRGHGIARVQVEYVGPASLEGSDDRRLEATLREGMPAPAPSLVRLAAAQPYLPRLPATAPMPPERPFDLNDQTGGTREAALPGPRLADGAGADERFAGRPPRQFSLRPVPREEADAEEMPHRPYLTSPVSAFAPGLSVGRQAVTSGHGLY